MIKKSQLKFIFYFVVVFIVSFFLLYSAGLVPETLKENNGGSLRVLFDKAMRNNQRVSGENPIRIVIDKIGVDVAVSNPNTTKVSVLDEYLKQGAVRYPGSGLLGQGNMFIFAHSTGIAVVNNQAYKAFNGLKKLTAGDIITVYGATKIYKYMVSSVILADQTEALVEFDDEKNMLTLSTCNTFGAKSERYIVEADYVE